MPWRAGQVALVWAWRDRHESEGRVRRGRGRGGTSRAKQEKLKSCPFVRGPELARDQERPRPAGDGRGAG